MFSFPPFLANLRRPLSLTCSSSTNDPNPSPARQLLPSLPPELWLLIICQATLSLPLYHTLTTPSRLAWFASLSLLSADFRALAQPELFSTVVVHSHEQLEQLVEVLERSLKLRKAVRGLHVRWREREGAEREGAGEGAKQLNERSADGWEDGVGRVARLVELREVSLSYAGGEEGRFDLNWVAGSRETLVKLELDSVALEGTPDILFPFLQLTSLTLRDCTLSPTLAPSLPSLFPSIRFLTLRSAPSISTHTIHTILLPLAPKLQTLSWSTTASADIGSGRAGDAVLLAILPLYTSLIALNIPISTLRHLRADQLPPSLARLRLGLRRTGEEAKEVLRVVEMLPWTVEAVYMDIPGWMSAQVAEELLERVRRRVAARVRLRLVEE